MTNKTWGTKLKFKWEIKHNLLLKNFVLGLLFVPEDAMALEKFKTDFSGDFHNFINNEFVPPGSNEYLDTEDPYTGQ